MNDDSKIGLKYVIVISIVIIGLEILNDAFYAVFVNLNHVKGDLLRIIFTAILVYFFCKGYKWGKYFTIIGCLLGGAVSILNGVSITMGSSDYPPIIGSVLLISGVTYLFISIFTLASRHIRYFFNKCRPDLRTIKEDDINSSFTLNDNLSRRGGTMKSPGGRVWSAFVSLYLVSLVIFIPYYNWTYIKDHGFRAWLSFGEVTATMKATIWPVYEIKKRLFGSDNPQQPNPDYRHYMNSLIAFEEAGDMLRDNNDVSSYSHKKKQDILGLFTIAVDEAQQVNYDFLESVHPDLYDKYINLYIPALKDMKQGVSENSRAALNRGINKYDEYTYWILERKSDMKFPGL